MKLLALNDEAISTFEFEIILIPEENIPIQLPYTTRTDMACKFPNEVVFSTNLAKYIANISTMKLSFSVLTSTGIIENQPIDFLFTNGFTFSGWNEYIFSYVTFIPLINDKKTIVPQEMVLKFSDNLFSSKLTLDNVKFIHGLSHTDQEKAITKYKTNCYPVIEVSNMYMIEISNLILENFIYPDK